MWLTDSLTTPRCLWCQPNIVSATSFRIFFLIKIFVFNNFRYTMEKTAPRLIILSSNEGQKLLSKSTCYNPYIHRIFAKQIGISNCGIQSAALLLNSEVLAKRDRENDHSVENNDIPYTESNMFSFEATTKVATQDYIYKRGLTLEETLNIFINHGKDAEAFHSANSSVDEFRTSF